MVAAHTSAGKTAWSSEDSEDSEDDLFDQLNSGTPCNPQYCQVVAEYAVAHALRLGMRTIYTSPIKVGAGCCTRILGGLQASMSPGTVQPKVSGARTLRHQAPAVLCLGVAAAQVHTAL